MLLSLYSMICTAQFFPERMTLLEVLPKRNSAFFDMPRLPITMVQHRSLWVSMMRSATDGQRAISISLSSANPDWTSTMRSLSSIRAVPDLCSST